MISLESWSLWSERYSEETWHVQIIVVVSNRGLKLCKCHQSKPPSPPRLVKGWGVLCRVRVGLYRKCWCMYSVLGHEVKWGCQHFWFPSNWPHASELLPKIATVLLHYSTRAGRALMSMVALVLNLVFNILSRVVSKEKENSYKIFSDNLTLYIADFFMSL